MSVSDASGDEVEPSDVEADPSEVEVEVEEMLDRRAHLLHTRGRSDAELASLTTQLRSLLATGQTVRALDPPGCAADRDLAERLVAREPVNPASSNRERDRRLQRDRRIYVLEHPSLPGRPINVLWVALCAGVPETLGEIVSPELSPIDPTTADTAVFYSIWNAEDGLTGLGSGAELVAATAERLRAELPALSTLTTISPIPGFRSWHDGSGGAAREAGGTTRDEHAAAGAGGGEPGDLLASCARYLTATSDDGRLLDPVARFHMGNGARLWRLLSRGDGSERGIQRSFGVMANYRYFPEDLEANRRHLEAGTPALGNAVAELLTHS